MLPITEDQFIDHDEDTPLGSCNAGQIAALREARDFFQCTLDSLSLSVAILDENGRILTINHAWKGFVEEIVGNVPDDVRGFDYPDFCRSLFGGSGEAGKFVSEGILDVLQRRREAFYLEYPVLTHDDDERWFTIRVTRFNWKGPMRVVVAHEEISDRKRYELMLAHLNEALQVEARHDPLTGLPNRLRMEEDLRMMYGHVQRYGHSFCVAFCDIDSFKAYNDHYGHLAGDEVLHKVAQTIASQSRMGDRAYRFGGEEFLIVLPEQSLDSAALTLDRIREAVEHLDIPNEGLDPPGVLTVSSGIAEIRPGSGKTLDDLLKEADTALYAAKERGRNRVEAGGLV